MALKKVDGNLIIIWMRMKQKLNSELKEGGTLLDTFTVDKSDDDE